LAFAEKILKEAQGATEITSIGGGSTIDVGKYVAWKLNIPHTAIPTTAGTGSEVTKFAVFTDEGRKVSLEDDKLIPHNYILNAENTTTLPPLHTMSSGLDALCQGIESYWSPKATNESRRWSKLAFRLASKTLLSSYENPESEVLRMRMLSAANYSGRAINTTRTSICHAISYPLTLNYGIPHGLACAMSLPYFAKEFGFDLKPLKILKRAPKYKIDKEMVATEALKSVRAKNTPKPVTKQMVIDALTFYEDNY